MLSFRSAIYAILLIATASGLAGCGVTTDLKQNEPLLEGPPVRDVVSPYQPALACLRAHLTPEQRNMSFGVLSFPDKTGKVNIAANDATGTLSTQGGEDRLITALDATGVRTVEVDPAFLNYLNWEMQRGVGGMLGDGTTYSITSTKGTTKTKSIPVIQGTLAAPNYLVSGAITAADFLPGEGAEFMVAGIGGGYRQYRMLVGMDAKATLMPFGGPLHVGGVIVATDHLSKQLVAYEIKAGVASFFGGPYYTAINAGKDGREAIQFSEGVMIDRVAYDLVSKSLGVSVCDKQVQDAEQYLAPRQERGAGSSHREHS